MRDTSEIHVFKLYMRHTWDIHERYMRDTYDKYIRYTWKIHEKCMRKTWEIHEKYMRNTWEIHEKYMFSKTHERYMRDTWEIIDLLILSMIAHTHGFLYLVVAISFKVKSFKPLWWFIFESKKLECINAWVFTLKMLSNVLPCKKFDAVVPSLVLNVQRFVLNVHFNSLIANKILNTCLR